MCVYIYLFVIFIKLIGSWTHIVRISDPWPYLTKRCPLNRGLIDRKARAGVGHSIKIFNYNIYILKKKNQQVNF